jgi:hypothetical protein
MLDQRGYEVFTFSDPAMYQVNNSFNYDCRLDHACADIIISEVNMPTESGFELIKNQKEKGCKIKYRALMSGDCTDSELQTAQKLGCRVFHKPFILGMMLWLDDCRKRIAPERKLSELFLN